MSSEEKNPSQLVRHLSPAGVWAFAIGTSIGWGSLVVTNNAYLGQAGPLGSVLGMLVGAAIMLVISRNYAYLMNAYPEAGGAYTYAKEVFGYDHGFLTAWFLTITYLAMLWANATSLPLFARYFLGEVFEFGKLYTIFGYDVYLGEALLSIAGILLFAFLCARLRRIIARCMIGMAGLFTLGILICFAAALLGRDASMSPDFLPDSGAISQVVKIACISPWAFIGFESISHGAEEFSFPKTKIFRVLVVIVLSTTLLYICVMLLSVTAYPSQYGSWLAYIRDLGNLQGIEALPAFYAARHYLGCFGVAALMLSLLALIFTSLIGNITALSRLFYGLSKDGVLPTRFSCINRHGVPGKAVLLIAGISVLIPFLGRTAVGWIVDVTTLGATLIYGLVSAAAMKLARSCGDRVETRTGTVGLVICTGFGLYLLLPNLFTAGSMESESFFLFVVWAVLGFVYFRVILKHDGGKRFGKSVIVWIALLSLVLFVSLVWMSRAIMDATSSGLNTVEDYYSAAGFASDGDIVSAQIKMIRQVCARSIVVVIIVFALSLLIVLNNYSLMRKRAASSELQLGKVRDLAYRDSLTGLKNKLAFTEAEEEYNGRISAWEQSPFAIVVCDVNGLKYVNDTQGHKAGDDYIRSAGRMVCSLFLHSPVYRTGGDEFAVILTGRDYEDREAIMKALHDQSVQNIRVGEVVVSGGLAEYDPRQTKNCRAVFEQADARMYEEKKLLKSLGAATRL